MHRGTRSRALGGFSETVILDTIRRARKGVSRVEIAGLTGLSAQTVSNVARRLLDAGIIRDAGQQILGVGKPRTILQLVPSSRYAIGVHVDPSVITYVLVDLGGRIVAHTATVRPDHAIAGMRDSIEAIISTSGVDRDRLLGVGIASPGPVDLERGIVLDPPLLEGWHAVALPAALMEATGLPVLLEKDVTAAAVAELWTSEGHERDDFLFFYYGTGVGVGLALGHQVVRGSTNNAGDAGHLIVDPLGPMCGCGRRGCLGAAVMPRALVQLAIEQGVVDAPGGALETDVVDRLLARVVALAEAGDSDASSILEEMAQRMGVAIVAIVNLLDLDSVVFGGPYWGRVSGFLLQRMPEVINSSRALVTTHPVAVTASTIGDDVTAVGAACLVLDNALWRPRTAALIISA